MNIGSKVKGIAKSKYRPEIDGLRAFAVISVIINHFNKAILPGGYLGVDIFFVISGYVITSSLLGRSSKDFKDFISGFYERRIKRLVPSLSVFVLITSFAICLFEKQPINSLKTGLASLLGVSNLYLLKDSTDYFAQSTDFNVFTHTWSLGVEEQFYILFPFLIWFSGFGRQTKNSARNLFMIVGATSFASLIGFLYFNFTNQPAAYFLMPTRFWEIASGCLIFICFQKREALEQFLGKVPPVLSFALIVAVMYLPTSMTMLATVLVVLLTCILIASLKKQTLLFRIFTNPRIVYIGLISYSLYLWHWGLLSLARWTIGVTKITTIPLLILIFLVSILSYELVEKKTRTISWSFRRIFTIILGILVLISSATIPYLLGTKFRGKLFLGNYKSKNPPLNVLKTSTYHVIGDSHAFDIYALLLNNGSYKLKRYAIGGCRFYFSESANCRKQIKNREKLLSNVNKGDVVIFASDILPYLKKDNKESDDIIKFFNSTLPTLVKKDVIMVFKLPHPKVNPPNVGTGLICKKEFFRPFLDQGCIVEGVKKNKFYIEMNSANSLLNYLKQKHPYLLFWNISELICPGDYCYPVKDNKQYLRDSNHLFLSSPTLSDDLVENLNSLIINK